MVRTTEKEKYLKPPFI